MNRNIACLTLAGWFLVGCPAIEDVKQVDSDTGVLDFSPDCPDPSIQFTAEFTSWPEDNGTNEATVTLTAEVRNEGLQAYLSDANQQAIYIYLQPMGGDSILLNEPGFFFQNLASEESVETSLELEWSAISNEFPNSYKAYIAYDPDIGIDNNPDNDDCRLENNEMTIDGMDIKQMWEDHYAQPE